MNNMEDIEAKLNDRDRKNIQKDLDSLMEKLKSENPDINDSFRDVLEIALKRVKVLNKEKYTPKKYR